MIHNGFDEIVQSFYVTLEETRILDQSRTQPKSEDQTNPGIYAERLSQLNGHLESLRLSSIESNDVHAAITEDCERKLIELSTQVFSIIINHPLRQEKSDALFVDRPPADVPDLDQPAVAFITELNILLRTKIKSPISETTQIIDAYASYQRRVLRQRSKPPIAYLAELRRSGTLHQVYSEQYDENIHEEDETDEAAEGLQQQQKQPHAHTITIVLGEVSKLLQPLGAWKSSLPAIEECNSHPQYGTDPMPKYLDQLCSLSIKNLNEEAQKLTSAIIKWIDNDHDIKGWIDRSISYHRKIENSSSFDILVGEDLASLERICNELSFLCQVLARYIKFLTSFIAPTSPLLDYATISTLLSQQCGNYATLEDYFACISLLKAKSIASPVPIITGENVYVPSIVEDAYYISQRALERAHETMSQHAIITVMHRIEEMWECGAVNEGMDTGKRGVYEALMGEGAVLDVKEVEEMGEMIDAEEEEDKNQSLQQQKQKNQGGSFYFASAFLDAIDQDISEKNAAPSQKAPSTQKRKEKKDSLSQLLSKVCLMNGLSSASSACSALSSLLDSFEPQQDPSLDPSNGNNGNNKLLKLSQENLNLHAKHYSRLLSDIAHQIVVEWCGPSEFADLLPVDRIQTYIAEQNYYIRDNATLMKEEQRVHNEIVKTLEEGRFIREVLKGGRCEGAVMIEIVKVLAVILAEETLLNNVLHCSNVRFTDWGALLLSTQVRTLQNLLCSILLDKEANLNTKLATNPNDIPSSSTPVASDPNARAVNTAPILARMERLAQAVAILQLEKPSDWIGFRYNYDDGVSTNGNNESGESIHRFLTRDEVHKVMSLRVDFSEEAVRKACGS